MKLPSASIVLLAYNQEAFVREAAEAALAQEGAPSEILFSDDCSADRTFEILTAVASAYKGVHKIILNRNSKNIGVTAHLKKAVSLTSGEWIVIMAGDDISAPIRVRALMETAASHPNSAGIASHFHEVTSDGQIRYIALDESRRMQKMQEWTLGRVMSVMRHIDGCYFLLGASATWRRDVFEKFPQLPDDKSINEDFILTWRAIMLGGTRIIEQDLIGYRKHSASLSATPSEDIGKDIADAQKQRKLFRSRRSFLFTIQDLDYALNSGIITEEAHNECVDALLDYLSYQGVLISWGRKSVLQRLDMMLRYWRPGLLRPGLRRLFERHQDNQ
jgi:glycosyltransferase involved in cell wall biosynthesis